MQEDYVAQEKDVDLSCDELVYAFSETKYLLNNVAARCHSPHLFAISELFCTGQVKMDAIRNEHILKNRLRYLGDLYKLKKCEESKIVTQKKTEKMEKHEEVEVEIGSSYEVIR